MRVANLLIVGVGLLGGSIALAARRRGVAKRVTGVGRRADVLERARNEGMLDDVSLHLSDAVVEADLIVFCTPVDCIADQVLEAAGHCRPGTLLTDVGSTKAGIVRAVRGRLPAGTEFVGSHPLAGSEKHGSAHARDDLFDGKLVIVTPDTGTSENALSQIRAFWSDLGARVRVMDAEEHDRALALTSHLPHLLSSALAGIVTPDLYGLTASGFRDVTRLAAGLPGLWSAIFRDNQPPLLAALDRLQARLRQFRTALEQDDPAALEALLEQGKKVRDDLSRLPESHHESPE
jgi:prephenate dehydrogenase